MIMNTIYLDNSSTTPVLPEVVEAMVPFFSQRFGNPSSLHALGMEARKALDSCREVIASAINAEEREIVFTSGGTESNNLAIFGYVNANRQKGNHIITSQIEHSSVLQPFRELEKRGLDVTRLKVNREGFVDLGELEKNISKKTIFVSIQHANHEVGTIQNIGEIGKICREAGIIFHADACQSFTKVPMDVKRHRIDLLTLNSHKIHGPKGIGALYIRDGIKLKNLFFGGGQENSLRSGTENIPGIVGFAKAVEIGIRDFDKNIKYMEKLRDKMISKLIRNKARLNGPARHSRLCNNVNVSFPVIEGEALVAKLSNKGICISTGSACASRSVEPSSVLKAIGLSGKEITGSIRASLSRLNTEKEINIAIEKILESVEELERLYKSSRIIS